MMWNLEQVRKYLGLARSLLSWLLPVNIRLILQAVLIGIDAFMMAYKSARSIHVNKVKAEIKETAEKIKDPALTKEERLKLNAEMEQHFKHFVDKSTAR